jgi:hypothetical protein
MGVLDWFSGGGLLGIGDGQPDYAAMGVDPKQLRMMQLSQGLLGLGAGLAGGRDWGEGISRGFSGAQASMSQAREDAMRDAALTRELERQKKEDEAAAARQAALAGIAPPEGIDPAQWQNIMTGLPELGADILGQKFKPFTPDLDTITKGALEETGYFDRDNNWVSLGSGPRWAPQQGPQDPEAIRLLRAAGIDPASEEGKTILRNKLTGGAQQEPEAIRLLRAAGIDPGSNEGKDILRRKVVGGTSQPSAYSEKIQALIDQGYSPKDAVTLALGGDMDEITRYQPVDPPLNPDTGGIDDEQLSPDIRYRFPDGNIYRWDGQQFIPY